VAFEESTTQHSSLWPAVSVSGPVSVGTQQLSPRHALRPSPTASAAIARAATGSSHQRLSSALPGQADQERRGHVGAEEILCALTLRGYGAHAPADALFGDPEQRHQHDRAGRQRDTDPAGVRMLAADQAAAGLAVM